MKRKLKKTNTSGILIILAMVIIAIIYASTRTGIIPNIVGPGTTGTSGVKWNCGDIQIDVNSVKEADSYVRFGIVRPAPADSKFEVFSITVTNKGTETKDFSGYRLALLADGTSYSPVSFSSIEKINLIIDGSTLDYPCSESKIASISRLVLNSGQSETGCKIFQILKSLEPASLNLYNLTGLKCSIEL